MALLGRKLESLLVSHALPKSIIFIHSRSLTQQSNNNDSIVNAISNSFKKTHSWDALTKAFSSVQLTHSLVQQILLQLNHPDHARSALNFFYWSAKTQNFQHQIYSYCIAIHILVHAHQLTEAKILIQSALKNCASDSTSIVESLLGSYNVVGSCPLVFDLLVQAYAKLRMLEDGFEEMEDMDLKPYDETFSHLIEGCAKAGEMKAK
ncbi:pentatricopeptide repeat-containing protein [Corchorus olitorius]|uniref:Pentatricopeptide repeat-containing protein n=1 Tax=Corchorus olitorius TaxID=93759 RepID=A0A1R3KTC8_9ROSI|nr:pentatricopeptide repeat-containing protein [Corchorus olitorius]